jgi:hypothetical protein
MSEIALKVFQHPSGCYSVTKTINGRWSSRVPRKLVGNTDKVEFDRHLEKLVSKLENAGHTVFVDRAN